MRRQLGCLLREDGSRGGGVTEMKMMDERVWLKTGCPISICKFVNKKNGRQNFFSATNLCKLVLIAPKVHRAVARVTGDARSVSPSSVLRHNLPARTCHAARKRAMCDAPSAECAASSSSSVAQAQQRAGHAADWVCVGHKSSFAARTTIKVRQRRVTVLRLTASKGAQPSWYCIDTVCYHAGGPLTDGALRSIDKRMCLQCPWHSYLVDIATGEALYMDLDRTYQSKGLRQRVHDIELRENHVWVRLRLAEKDIPSDVYAYGPRFAGRPEEKDNVPEFPDW